jgi:hypothetical protein
MHGRLKKILFGLFVAKPDLLMEKNSAKKIFCQIGASEFPDRVDAPPSKADKL